MEIKIPIWLFQILNFLLLCLILRKFLFKPVTGILDKRRREWRTKLEEAEKNKNEAQKTQAKLESERKSLQEERSQILSKAREEAEARAKDAEAALRKEISEERQRIQEQLRREWDRATGELAGDVASLVAGFSETLLKEMAGPEWQAAFLADFGERLDGLSREERREFQDALSSDEARVRLRSGFPVSPEDKRSIETKLREVLGEALSAIEWEESSDLLCGIEMRTGGVALDATLKGRLQQGAAQLLKTARSVPVPKEAASA